MYHFNLFPFVFHSAHDTDRKNKQDMTRMSGGAGRSEFFYVAPADPF